MRKLFNTNFNNEGIHFMLLVTRIAIAAFMLTHGLQKLPWLLAGGEIQFADPIGVGQATSLVLTVFAEVVCSILVLLGLGTRLAVIPLIITMLVAILIIHAPDAFEKKELAVHFLVTYLFLLVAGSGKYSVDHLISRSMNSRRR
ncbi:DoxX family protein [Pedobacter foliorum]|uniref:DoxX family protein n=1 Tax=Pedobacter foliorum TaxID=2739058 RepID=UPI0015637846|nr:DoxX family protein [Pedobacter foliorum]NRF40254.1 DoxX family protein [Pedobacter foliorum]